MRSVPGPAITVHQGKPLERKTEIVRGPLCDSMNGVPRVENNVDRPQKWKHVPVSVPRRTYRTQTRNLGSTTNNGQKKPGGPGRETHMLTAYKAHQKIRPGEVRRERANTGNTRTGLCGGHFARTLVKVPRCS